MESSARRRVVAIRTALLALGLLAGVPQPGEGAQGTVDLSWGTCSPVVTDLANPLTGPNSLVFSELGNDQAHVSYQVYFIVGSADRTVPDAWRFDVSGCQGGAQTLVVHHLPPAAMAKACPAFQGENASVQQWSYSFVPTGAGLATTLMRGALVNTYPAGATSDPGQRSFLAEFVFDHTFSVAGPTTPGVDCGGFETPLCFALLAGGNRPPGSESAGITSYVRQSDGLLIPLDPGANSIATVRALQGCWLVPAEASTWGQVKGIYRR